MKTCSTCSANKPPEDFYRKSNGLGWLRNQCKDCRRKIPRGRPPRIDWFRVIIQLEHAGCAQRDIAAKLGTSKGWVIHLKDSPGAEPRFDDGMALLDLWCDAMDKPLCDVPREMAYG